MEARMPIFIVLAKFTDKGAHAVKDTINRADKFKALAKNAGVTVKDMYWTIGTYDVVTVCEAPDDEAATALSMSIAARGHVRTETLRGFTTDEMTRIVGKMV
jgi:uncharacterized protein with GYD domain